MRISRIEVYQRDLPVTNGPYRMARTAVESLDTTVVRMVTDTGLVGWGETCPVGPVYQPHHAGGARAAIAEIAPGLIGIDPLASGPARVAMDERLNGHGYAKAALDTALWDLAGRHFGARVCDLLGGAHHERVPSYYAVGVGAPEETARIAAEKAAEGFTRLQIKLGGRPVEADIDTLHAVADAVPRGVRLAADGNRGWTARDALLISNACAGLPLTLEQPCNTIEETVSIRSRLRHPVFLDESAEDLPAVLRAITANACDGFGFKLTRAGGIGAMRAIRDVCAARSMPHTCDDAWGSDIIAAACVHVAATVSPSLLEGVWIAAPYIDGHYDTERGITIREGFIDVPQGAGLGIEIDPATFGAPDAVYG
jgi:L-alanine-DL-glutamate epimerase-like enolase superfamily enzyme